MAAPRTRARFHALEVAEVRPLTDDALEVTFAVPEELAGDFDYFPGQHVALRREIDGREVRRSYSLCRMPQPVAEPVEAPGPSLEAPVPSTGSETGRSRSASTTISVAIKRDQGGLFSAWAHEHLRPGMRIDVMSPQGSFTTTLDLEGGVHVAGIAAGSGITPLMALAASVLASSERSRFTLLYTNRSTRDVMFLDELADLKDRYPARFALFHVLTREQRAVPLLSGRIDEEKLGGILEHLIPPATVDEWFLCGPLPLVQLCREALAEAGVDSARVRFELFTTDADPREPVRREIIVRADEPVTTIEFTLDGQASTVTSPVSANEAILDAALRVRADVPFACAGGVCGTCRARLVEGSVHMTENYALEPEELERGFVLTCQSHPTSDRVVVDYDI